MKKYKVSVAVVREFTRIVTAKTESQAIRAAKKMIVEKEIKIRMKDFDPMADNAY
jgi:hypothetical protein